MSDRISEKIDQYTKSNINRLRTAEEQSGRKLTKYDIAQQMLSEGKLSQSDFSSWMNTREGYDSYTLTNQEKQALKKGSIWSFNNVSPVLGEQSYLDTFRNDEYIKEPITGIKLRKTPSKTQTSASSELKKESEIRKSVVDLLLSNAEKALLMLKNYHNGIGYVSSDAFVQGMNVIGSTTWDNITGRDDFVTVFENESELEKLIANLKSLKSKSTKPMEFAQEFKKIYGIEFDAKNFEKLSEVSTQINELGVYENLSKYFEYGINKIETSDASSFEPAALLAPIFGDNIAQAKEYIDDLRKECKDETELKEKLKLILIESKQEADKKLKEYNPSKLENEYKQAYKEAMGNSQSDEVIEQYIQIQKMNAMGTEVAGTVALALLTSGSSAVLKTGSKVVSKLGAKLGGQVMKAGMTATMAAVPAAETIVGGLTSKDGLTAEKGEEAWEELKNGLMYGSFGAYVSGPLGNLFSKVLSKNPQIFSQIVASQKFSLGAGAAMETTADVLFDRITSDMTFKESMAQNGIMNFGMMFVGARVHNDTNLPDVDLSQVKIEKMRDGSFNLKANGKVFFKAKNENELALVTLALGAKLKSSKKFAETPKAFAEVITKRINDFKKVNNIENDQKFYEEVLRIFKEEMDLGEAAPTLNFNQTHQNARAMYSDTDNVLYIFMNNFPKDRAKGVAILAHELKHFLQFKEELLTGEPAEAIDKIINAKAKNLMRTNPQLSQEQAQSIVQQWYVQDGDYKPHIYDILLNENWSRNELDNIYGYKVQEYLKNEECYVDKNESLAIDNTLKSYENQVTEKEAYDVGDAVGTAFSKEILGINKVIKTRESNAKSEHIPTKL